MGVMKKDASVAVLYGIVECHLNDKFIDWFS